MAMWKATLIWNYFNPDGRAASWTESFYTSALQSSQALGRAGEFAERRAGMLPGSIYLAGTRVGNVETPGISSFSRFQTLTGVATAQTQDIPQMALQINLRTGAGAERTFEARGLPDGLVLLGAYAPDAPFRLAVQRFCNMLFNGAWYMRVLDLAQVLRQVVDVGETGILTTLGDPGWATGDRVRFFRTRTNAGGVVKGDYPITRLTGTTYQMVGWEPGATVSKGQVRRIAYTYDPIVSASVIGTTTRKVGAPLLKYRGRATGRR